MSIYEFMADNQLLTIALSLITSGTAIGCAKCAALHKEHQ